ncbi:MAG: hypothetical protein KBG00_07935 [Rhodoferax sp.]|jgi:hypothetical protein|uniref:hypothetical protein n=1 Tax=Rhodoferax sp. TaxID=50421 RepID=UPI001B58E549|nr:hypothetical protein [Rhodoferax sp.]MBP9148698.1 hypothetical protein [Rhodoferax sp.]MBP9736268.1 hypothetical protein [Rhodoferax sp.]
MSRIYRGPNDRQPKTVSGKTVAAALLPATFVTELVATLAAATAPGPMVRLLGNRDFYSEGSFTATDPLLTAYASGDTGVAYVLEPGQTYQVALAAATYTYGQELTIAAAGRAASAASTNVVIGFFKGTPGAFAAGALADVEIANAYTKA